MGQSFRISSPAGASGFGRPAKSRAWPGLSLAACYVCELTPARDFLDHRVNAADGHRGRILLPFDGSDAAGKRSAAQSGEFLEARRYSHRRWPSGCPRPEGPSLACHARITGTDALVPIAGSAGASRAWVAAGKLALPAAKGRAPARCIRPAIRSNNVFDSVERIRSDLTACEESGKLSVPRRLRMGRGRAYSLFLRRGPAKCFCAAFLSC